MSTPEHSAAPSDRPERDPAPVSDAIEQLLRSYQERLQPTEQGQAAPDSVQPTPMDTAGESSERPPAHVELGDIVQLYKPYHPVRGLDRQRGPFGFGIVAEILSTLPDGRTRNVSLYLYDPDRREIFMGPNGIPEFVDCHCSEFRLYKRATEMGYLPTDPEAEESPAGPTSPAA